MHVETVKINDDNRRGFKIINKTDFDSKVHTLYGESKSKPRPRKKADK